MGGITKLSINTKSQTLFKLLGLSTLCLAILSISVLNVIANTNNISRANAVGSTNTANLANASSSPYISLSLTNIATGSTDDPNLVLQIPHEGGIATGGHTISISTNANEGYVLTLSSTTNNTDLVNTKDSSKVIKASEGTFTNRVIELANNTWGRAWPAPHTGCSGSTNSVSTTAQYDSNSLAEMPTTFCYYSAIPAKSASDKDKIVEEQDKATDSREIEVYYRARVDDPTSTLAGDYRAEVVYTATAKLPPAPTVTRLILNDTALTNQTKKYAIEGDNLASTYNVYIDYNHNGVEDEGEAATNVTTYPNTKQADTIISFTNPSTAEPGAYSVYVETQGGVAKLQNAFIVQRESICRSGDSNSDCQVNIDDNMIPIKYTGNETSPEWISIANKEDAANPGDWYDYNSKKWANAVTVKKEALAKYKDKSVVIDNDDVLGYWVYIPAYIYEVQRPNAVDRVVPDEYELPDGSTIKNEFIIQFTRPISGVFTKDEATYSPAQSCNADISTAEQMWIDGRPLSGADFNNANILAKDYRTECGVNRTPPVSKDSMAKPPAKNSTWGQSTAFTNVSFSGNESRELQAGYGQMGFWVGKFETTGTKTNPTVKPNQHANIYDYIGEFYTMAKSIGVNDPENTGGNTVSGISQNSHGLNKATSHMMKNSEWGAVAYLSSSKYGAGVNEVQINSAYPSSADADGQSSRYGITGCGPSGDGDASTYTDGTALSSTTIESETACSQDKSRAYYGRLGQLASTTNNVYGVYDMSGGAWEYVMGSRTTNDTQTDDGLGIGEIVIGNPIKEPYVDLYKVSDGFGTKPNWSSGSSENNYGFDVCTWDTCGGHALHETKRVQSAPLGSRQSWGSDYSYFVYFAYSFFLRGATADDGSYAGLFGSFSNEGFYGHDLGFRSVLVPGWPH